jgi:hypothetical protein
VPDAIQGPRLQVWAGLDGLRQHGRAGVCYLSRDNSEKITAAGHWSIYRVDVTKVLQFNLCLVVMYDKLNCGLVGVILKLSQRPSHLG